MALTFSLTLNDINKPIHGFITPNVDKKRCHLPMSSGQKFYFGTQWRPSWIVFYLQLQNNNIKNGLQRQNTIEKVVFSIYLTYMYTGPSPGPLPSPAMELTGEDGDRCRPKRNWRRRYVQFFIMMRWCIIRWKMRRSRIRRSLLSEGRLLCRLLGRLLSSDSTTTSARHQENMMRLKQMDDFNI